MLLLEEEVDTRLGEFTFSISPMVFASMFSIVSTKSCENNSIFTESVILQLVIGLQNPQKDKAALKVEKAKPQNLKSNLTW